MINTADEGRALRYLKKRNAMLEEAEKRREALEEETKKRRWGQIDSKYQGGVADDLEEAFKKETVGLVSAEDFKKKREELVRLREEREKKREEEEAAAAAAASSRPKLKLERQKKAKLSFGEEAEDDGMHNKVAKSLVKKKDFSLGKNPEVDTDFLPDRQREQRLRSERARLVEEYKNNVEKEKGEILEITYSYWDGSGHRRNLRIAKGSTIGQFLEAARNALAMDFAEVRALSASDLMYIKEDVILPHHVSFYELIRSKARGKSGPLFHFDVHDDIRLMSDTRVEKDESHAGKIVDRKWYDRNKHIFPASRWEVYDPNKTFETYTVHGREVNAKN